MKKFTDEEKNQLWERSLSTLKGRLVLFDILKNRAWGRDWATPSMWSKLEQVMSANDFDRETFEELCDIMFDLIWEGV